MISDRTDLLSTAIDMAKVGVGYLADLLAQLVSGIRRVVVGSLTVLSIGAGCQSRSDAADKPSVQPEVVSVAPVEAPPVDDGPKKLGSFMITFYYVANEDEVVAKKQPANDNTTSEDGELASIAPPALVTIYGKDGCDPIAEVSREFASALDIQGTGKLRDGRVLNVWGRCKCERSPCFKVTESQWGTAGSGRPLQPFRTVAVDPKLIKLGSLLYVPLLEGRTMPGRAPWGGFVHDGCLVADDTGGGIKDQQLDLFVGKRGWFLGMAASGSRGSHSWARHVPVFDGSKICERKGRHVARKTGGV